MARVTVTGAAGQLGRQLVSACAGAGHSVTPLAHEDLDLADPGAASRLAETRPQIVLNAAAWTDVDGCARDPERAMLLNGRAPGWLAGAVGADALFVQISTNEVFDGTGDRAYREDDPTNPINPYGASKLAGELAVAAAARRHLIVRTAWLFGPGGRNFVTKILAAAATSRGEPLEVVEDEFGNPTWAPSLAHAILQAAELAATGRSASILHLAGEPPASRLDWARATLGLVRPDRVVVPISQSSFNRVSQTPRRAILSTELAQKLGIPRLDWRAPLVDYVQTVTGAAV